VRVQTQSGAGCGEGQAPVAVVVVVIASRWEPSASVPWTVPINSVPAWFTVMPKTGSPPTVTLVVPVSRSPTTVSAVFATVADVTDGPCADAGTAQASRSTDARAEKIRRNVIAEDSMKH